MHVALLTLPDGVDLRGPGGAITLALCGCWEHPPPCPIAPHHTAAQRSGDALQVRTVFATEPEREREVRRRIDDALAHGHLPGPDDAGVAWNVLSSGPGSLEPNERDLAARLISG